MAATVGSETWHSGELCFIIQRFPTCRDVSKWELHLPHVQQPRTLSLILGNGAIWAHFRAYYGKNINISGIFSQCPQSVLEDISPFPSGKCSWCCPARLEGFRGSFLTKILKLAEPDLTMFCALKRYWEWPKAPTGYLRKASFIAACRSSSSSSSLCGTGVELN